ncbi:uncharacterized protein LOC131853820 isoform X2 [Achroia grisella]|uniref:uncharacterized protein LOC131853820 isoform X2 n=1 Tax=Achroia grisella TaxID=688607 RepID=UPI0027D2F3BC|nr:uncharacterized protein LOC131853820 isoform X2 [Achroia grisella]
MSLPPKVNKENFRLLDLSSDEDSEDLHLEIIPSRKKRISRRERSRINTPRTPEPNIGTEVRCALRWAVRGTLLLWLLMLTWICAELYDQVSVMRLEFNKVSTSSSSVGDALQVCHTAAKELRANATDFNIRLAKLEQEHQELAKRVEEAGATIAAVSEKLAAAPMLADTPNRLAELQRTVAYFGSQIKGYDASIESAHKQALNAAMGVEDIKTLLQQLHAKTNETVANVSANMKAEDELKAQVSALNGTLTARVEELQSKVLEISRSTSTVAPTTSTTTTTTAATPASSSAPSVTTPPGSPAKPMVSN